MQDINFKIIESQSRNNTKNTYSTFLSDLKDMPNVVDINIINFGLCCKLLQFEITTSFLKFK